MNELNSIELKYQHVNQAYRDFKIANADFPIEEKYADIENEMKYLPTSYKQFVKLVTNEDQNR